MSRFYKRISGLGVACIALLHSTVIIASPPIIAHYPELANALSAGTEVRAIISFKQCDASPTNKPSDFIRGGLNFTQFNQYKIQVADQLKEIIATSITMLVNSSQFGPVYNYVRLRIFNDDSVELISQLLDPVHFTVLSQYASTCHLSSKDSQRGVTLYPLSSSWQAGSPSIS